jgi:hypothetical protein
MALTAREKERQRSYYSHWISREKCYRCKKNSIDKFTTCNECRKQRSERLRRNKMENGFRGPVPLVGGARPVNQPPQGVQIQFLKFENDGNIFYLRGDVIIGVAKAMDGFLIHTMGKDNPFFCTKLAPQIQLDWQ